MSLILQRASHFLFSFFSVGSSKTNKQNSVPLLSFYLTHTRHTFFSLSHTAYIHISRIRKKPSLCNYNGGRAKEYLRQCTSSIMRGTDEKKEAFSACNISVGCLAVLFHYITAVRTRRPKSMLSRQTAAKALEQYLFLPRKMH